MAESSPPSLAAAPQTGSGSLARPTRKREYGIFLCYSHTEDFLFAARLQRALEQLGKPWYSRRHLNVFRDETDLTINPELWPSIQAALEDSEYLVFLASPGACQSEWVPRELLYWFDGLNRDPSHFLIALTAGDLVWDSQSQDFDWSRTTVLPGAIRPFLQGKPQPLWADFRVPKRENSLSLSDSAFRTEAVRLAAKVHGLRPKELDSEDLKQHRRTTRLAIAAVLLLSVLASAALVFGLYALSQRDIARQAQIEENKQRKFAEKQTSIANKKTLEAEKAEASERVQRKRAEAASAAERKQRERAEEERALAESRQFAAQATALPIHESPQRLALAIDAVKRRPTEEAFRSLREALPLVLNRLFFIPRPQPGHLSIQQLILTRDESRLIAVQSDGQFRVRNFPELDQVKLLGSWSGALQQPLVVLTPDGTRAVIAKADGPTKVWDITTGKELYRLPYAGSEWDYSVALSPDGALGIAGTSGGEWRRFDVQTGKTGPPVKAHIKTIYDIAFNANGSLFFTASTDQSLYIWSTAEGKRLTSLRGTEAPGWSVVAAFSSRVDEVAVLGEGGRVRIHDALTGTVRAEMALPHPIQPPSHLVFDSNGDEILVAYGPDAWLCDVRTGHLKASLAGHSGTITSVAFGSARNLLLTTSLDGTARVWDKAGRTLAALDSERYGLTTALFAKGDDWVLTGGIEGQLRAWEWKDTVPASRFSLPGHRGEINHVSFSPLGRVFASSSDDGTVRLWDSWSWQTVAVLEHSKRREIGKPVFSPDGSRLITYALFDDEGHLWDASSGAHISSFPFDSKAGSVLFRPDGKTFVTLRHPKTLEEWGATDGKRLRGWDLSTGKPPADFPMPFEHRVDVLGFSPDNAMLATRQRGSVQLLDSRNGASLGTIPNTAQAHLGFFTPDSRTFIAADVSGTVKVWDIAGRRVRFTITGCETGNPHRPQLSPDGRFLTAWPADRNAIEVWDVRSGSRLAELTGHSNLRSGVTDNAFSPDGRFLIVGAKDGQLRVYHASEFLPLDELWTKANAILPKLGLKPPKSSGGR